MHRSLPVFLYFSVVAVASYLVPALSVSAGTQYLFYSVLGKFIYYLLSLILLKNRILFYLGTVSYPVFLLPFRMLCFGFQLS